MKGLDNESECFMGYSVTIIDRTLLSDARGIIYERSLIVSFTPGNHVATTSLVVQHGETLLSFIFS